MIRVTRETLAAYLAKQEKADMELLRLCLLLAYGLPK